VGTGCPAPFRVGADDSDAELRPHELLQSGPTCSGFTAILADTIDEMTEQAVRAREADDAWAGFAAFAEDFVQLRASSCGLHAALGGGGGPDVETRVERLRDAVRELVRHAQNAGAIRGDVDWVDVPFALGTAIPADHTLGMAARPDQWRRNLAIVLGGLRG
jgi:hypothetical protein